MILGWRHQTSSIPFGGGLLALVVDTWLLLSFVWRGGSLSLGRSVMNIRGFWPLGLCDHFVV